MQKIYKPTTEQDLIELLMSKSVPLNTWGKLRTVTHLYEELVNNEAFLTIEEDSVVRHINVVSVAVNYKDTVLLQYKQEFVSGEINDRIKLPSEKMIDGEDYESVCKRLLKEELGISIDVSFTHMEDKEESYIGIAYPGLHNTINLHFFSTILPLDFHIEQEYIETTHKQKTFFKWFPKDYLKKVA